MGDDCGLKFEVALSLHGCIFESLTNRCAPTAFVQHVNQHRDSKGVSQRHDATCGEKGAAQFPLSPHSI